MQIAIMKRVLARLEVTQKELEGSQRFGIHIGGSTRTAINTEFELKRLAEEADEVRRLIAEAEAEANEPEPEPRERDAMTLAKEDMEVPWAR